MQLGITLDVRSNDVQSNVVPSNTALRDMIPPGCPAKFFPGYILFTIGPGGKHMPELQAGVKAPEIKLPLLDGREFSLDHARQRGPMVVAFFKVSCPVCQFAFPYLERIYKAYSESRKVTVVGVSQDNAKDTTAFNREFGVGFPTLLDPAGKYPASNAYKLIYVPSIFLIS